MKKKFLIGEKVHTTSNKNGIISVIQIPTQFEVYTVIFPEELITPTQVVSCRVHADELRKGWIDDKPGIDELSPVTEECVKKYAGIIDFENIKQCNLLYQPKYIKSKVDIVTLTTELFSFWALGFDTIIHTKEVGEFSFTVVYNENSSNGLYFKDCISVKTQLMRNPAADEFVDLLNTRAHNGKVVLGTSIIELDGISYSLNEFMTLFCKYVYKPKK